MAALRHQRLLAAVIVSTGIAIVVGNQLWKFYTRSPRLAPPLQPRLAHVATGARPNLRYRNHNRLLTWDPTFEFQKPIPRPLSPQYIRWTKPHLVSQIEKINTTNYETSGIFIKRFGARRTCETAPSTDHILNSTVSSEPQEKGTVPKSILSRSYIDNDGFLTYRNTQIFEFISIRNTDVRTSGEHFTGSKAFLAEHIKRRTQAGKVRTHQHLLAWEPVQVRQKKVEDYFGKKTEQRMMVRVEAHHTKYWKTLCKLVENQVIKELVAEHGFSLHPCVIHEFSDLCSIFRWKFMSGTLEPMVVTGPHEEEYAQDSLNDGPQSVSASRFPQAPSEMNSALNHKIKSTLQSDRTTYLISLEREGYEEEAHQLRGGDTKNRFQKSIQNLKSAWALGPPATTSSITMSNVNDRASVQALHPSSPILKFEASDVNSITSNPFSGPCGRLAGPLRQHVLLKEASVDNRGDAPWVDKYRAIASVPEAKQYSQSTAPYGYLRHNHEAPPGSRGCYACFRAGCRPGIIPPKDAVQFREWLDYLMEDNRRCASADVIENVLTDRVQQEWKELMFSTKNGESSYAKVGAVEEHDRTKSSRTPYSSDFCSLEQSIFVWGQLHGIRMWIHARCLSMNGLFVVRERAIEIVEEWASEQLRISGHNGIYPVDAKITDTYVPYSETKTYHIHHQTISRKDNSGTKRLLHQHTYYTLDGSSPVRKLPRHSHVDYRQDVPLDVEEWTEQGFGEMPRL